MTSTKVVEKAKELGIKTTKKMAMPEIIRMIQEREGNSPCYQAIPSCGQSDCAWRETCQQ